MELNTLCKHQKTNKQSVYGKKESKSSSKDQDRKVISCTRTEFLNLARQCLQSVLVQLRRAPYSNVCFYMLFVNLWIEPIHFHTRVHSIYSFRFPFFFNFLRELGTSYRLILKQGLSDFTMQKRFCTIVIYYEKKGEQDQLAFRLANKVK